MEMNGVLAVLGRHAVDHAAGANPSPNVGDAEVRHRLGIRLRFLGVCEVVTSGAVDTNTPSSEAQLSKERSASPELSVMVHYSDQVRGEVVSHEQVRPEPWSCLGTGAVDLGFGEAAREYCRKYHTTYVGST